MGNYDRDFQWRMMQQNNSDYYTPFSSTSTNTTISGHNNQRCGNTETNTSDSRQVAAANPSYFLNDRINSMKRPSITSTSSSSTRIPEYPYMMGKSDQNASMSIQQPSGQLQEPSLYNEYEQASTPQQNTNITSEWGYTHVPRLPSPSALLSRPSLSLSSPTVVFGGMEPLINDYGSNFYPLWNGQGTNVIGYEGDSEGDGGEAQETIEFGGLPPLPSVTVAASMDQNMNENNEEEELKMEYPPLTALNQGDLDYIYGSMDSIPSPAVSTMREAQTQRLYYPTTDRYKRETSTESLKNPNVQCLSPAQSGLSVTGMPSGFRSLARSSGSLELKQRAQLQAAYQSQKSAIDANLFNVNSSTGSRRSSGASAKRPRSRQCDFPGCENRARSHQKCKKHGGAHVCEFEGCTKNSQSRGLCIAHGGGSRCKVDGCTRASQSKGLCKSHGGGEFCAVEECRKKAHLKHLCRNHGGGVRCKNPKCIKWAQRKGWCMAHAKEVFGS